MKLLKKLPGYCYYVCFMMLLLSIPTFAYLDPGTVTYVVSMVAALFIAAGAALAIFRRKVKLFFQNLGKKKQPEATIDVDDSTVVDPMDEIDPMSKG